mmetsp:Transcript_14720/g.52979  ORF Transcript_14720/g.52979 Transcript_14720/m.52979 type:complete len:399 (+) Transcript_14720:457-1653(+)
MGKTHELLSKVLLEHGRLSLRQLVELVSFNLRQREMKDFRSLPDVEKVLSQLLDERCIEIVPEHRFAKKCKEDDDYFSPSYSSPESRKTQSGSHCGNIVAQTPANLIRFEDMATRTRCHSLWRINFVEFNRRFQHKACSATVRTKVDDETNHLLLLLLDILSPREVKDRGQAASIHQADILPMICKSRKCSSIVAKERLKQLCDSTGDLVSCFRDVQGGNNYSVDVNRTMQLIRTKEIEAIIRERFGVPACRIFRLLLLKSNLEQKQVSELAMIPVKDTRELLYKLLKAEYVQIQEVSRTSDHAPSRTFFLWRVDLARAIENVERELFRTTSNLRSRLLHELARERETLSLLECAADKVTVALTPGQRCNLARMRTIGTRLESSLQRLDELLPLFDVI